VAPARETDGLAGVLLAERPASMGAVSVHREIQSTGGSRESREARLLPLLARSRKSANGE
jgi:hypothetical protein